MSLPTPTSPLWADIIQGKTTLAFEFFAVKIFLGSAQAFFKQDPSLLPQLSADLYKLFEKNQNLPSAKRDLEKLASLGVEK